MQGSNGGFGLVAYSTARELRSILSLGDVVPYDHRLVLQFRFMCCTEVLPPGSRPPATHKASACISNAATQVFAWHIHIVTLPSSPPAPAETCACTAW